MTAGEVCGLTDHVVRAALTMMRAEEEQEEINRGCARSYAAKEPQYLINTGSKETWGGGVCPAVTSQPLGIFTPKGFDKKTSFSKQCVHPAGACAAQYRIWARGSHTLIAQCPVASHLACHTPTLNPACNPTATILNVSPAKAPAYGAAQLAMLQALGGAAPRG